MAKGFRVAEDGHPVNILPPINVTGGAYSQAVDLSLASHVSIVLALGVGAADLGAITLLAGSATAAEGAEVAGATAVPFDVYKQETPGSANDVLGARVQASAAGFVPAADTNVFYVLEFDADQLPAGLKYLQLAIANGANAVLASAVAILSGLRYAGLNQPSMTV